VAGECEPDQICNRVTGLCEPVCDVPDAVDPLSPWPMFSGCPTNRGVSRHVGAASAEVRWSADLGETTDGVYASPTIGQDGTIYLPAVSLPPSPRYALHAFWPDGTLRFVGPSSNRPPSIAVDGTLWLATGTWFDGQGLHHLDRDGRELGLARTGIAEAVAPHFLPGGDVIVGNATLERFDPTLALVWSRDPGTSDFSMTGDVAIAPDGTIYACTIGSQGFSALAPDGSVRWRHGLPDGSCLALTVGPDGTIYAGSNSGVVAVAPDGARRWQNGLGQAWPRIVWISISPDGTVLASGTGERPGLFALSPGGEEAWRRLEGGAWSAARPVIDREGTIYCGLSTSVHAMNVTDGSSRWVHQDTALCGSPAIGADGTVYAVCGKRLLALGP
jgi:hypothetical protein